MLLQFIHTFTKREVSSLKPKKLNGVRMRYHFATIIATAVRDI